MAPRRLALITGVAGEVGAHLAGALLSDGWAVCGLDLRIPATQPPDDFTFLECDLSSATATRKALDVLHARHPAFDAVINCAGLIANGPVMSFVDGELVPHDPALWDRVIGSCLSSAFYVTTVTATKMVAAGKRGVIINISSVCARGNPGQVAYSAAKAGMNGMTVAVAKELGAVGIRCVAIAPGYFDTTSTREHVAAARLKEIRNAVPLKRLGKLEELAAAVQFVLGNEYVNGKVLELDGGLTL